MAGAALQLDAEPALSGDSVWMAAAITFSSCSSSRLGAMSRMVRSGVVMGRSPWIVVISRFALREEWMVGSAWLGSNRLSAAAGRSLRTAVGPANFRAAYSRASGAGSPWPTRWTPRQIGISRLRRTRCSIDLGSTPLPTRSWCVTTPRCNRWPITKSTSACSSDDFRRARGCPCILGSISDSPETTSRFPGCPPAAPPDPPPKSSASRTSRANHGRTPAQPDINESAPIRNKLGAFRVTEVT